MKNKKKGFTLVEVVISLSIGVIVMSLVASLIVIVSNISNKQAYESQCQAEYQRASQLVNTFFNNYQTSEFMIDSVSNEKVVIKRDTEEYELRYIYAENKLTANILNLNSGETETKNLIFQKIIEINFSSNGNLILCKYLFDNYPTYSNLVTFGV